MFSLYVTQSVDRLEVAKISDMLRLSGGLSGIIRPSIVGRVFVNAFT